MALRFERRHLSFRSWYIKRPSSRGGPGIEDCCLLLLEGGCLNLLQGGVFELLSCGATPPPGTCPTLPLPGSAIFTPVTYNPALTFNSALSGTTIVADQSVSFNANPQSFAATDQFIVANGQGFQFTLAGAANVGQLVVGLGQVGQVPAVDCGNNSITIGNSCRWRDASQFPFFAFLFDATFAFVNIQAGNNFAVAPVTNTSVCTIIRCNDVVCFYVDGVLKVTSPMGDTVYPQAQLNICTLINRDFDPPNTVDLIKDAFFITNITCA